MKSDKVFIALYDISMSMNGESSAEPLIKKVIQKLLYHTSFSSGFYFENIKENKSRGDYDSVLVYGIGDLHLSGRLDLRYDLPVELAVGKSCFIRDKELLSTIFEGNYFDCMRLPVSDDAMFILLSSSEEHDVLARVEYFEPILNNFAKKLNLCKLSDDCAVTVEREIKNSRSLINRYRQSVEFSSDMFMFISTAGKKFVDANSSALSALGYSLEELTVLTFSDIVENYSSEDISEAFKKLTYSDTTVIEWPVKLKKKDGELISLDMKFHIVKENMENIVIAVARN